MKKRSRRKGFTTVELVIVIAVIAILATVLVPTFSNLVDKARESAALQEASSIFMHYSIDNVTNLGTKKDFFIKAKGYYFRVSDGELQEDGTTTAPTEVGTIIVSSDTDAPYCKAEPITEPTTEPVTEPATEPETEPATEPETHNCADISGDCRCDYYDCNKPIHNEVNGYSQDSCFFCKQYLNS